MKYLSNAIYNLLLFGFLLFQACSNDSIPKECAGTWKENVKVSIRYPADNEFRFESHDHILLQLEISDDHKVNGSIGNASIENAELEINRGKLGKWLNIKTDYIIKNGEIKGHIVDTDPHDERNFTIPFNMKENKISGSIMVIFPSKYPYPLCRVNLMKSN
ncbi:MAG: hypothetical protein H8E61_09000 [Bacteroidetes bacterium]|nr:hypothetical protein [Bacteroidota bacterium]